MNKPLTKIPDIAYSIEGDLITMEQSTGCGEFSIVEIHKIHLQLLAEQMGLVEPVHQAHMSEVVNDEITELFWSLENHWQAICKDKHMDPDHMVEAKNLYNKLYSICRLIGLDPASLSNLGHESDKPIYPPTCAKEDSIARATNETKHLVN
ncbi:hypothetical protein A4F89_05150 [Polynucleobacter asymbioticus]|uniref:hypothetical protein n=1 Tax=Polynucleobacter asymbioticus TaxID=576611 RepID=UPI0008FB505E|nr:hypothetical protein [Polynucleobacter asymbioticus]APB98763.1 hypothetical protein A4F89_05150 [Polynucleobacter asymbioticus]